MIRAEIFLKTEWDHLDKSRIINMHEVLVSV